MTEKRCTYKEPAGNHCGSYAFNLWKDDIDQGAFCDVHYWQARAEQAPAWHDSPTCAGTWLCDEGEGSCYDWRACRIEWLDDPELKAEDVRWYGPISEDKPCAKS